MYSIPFAIESKPYFPILIVHKVDYTEEMLRTKLKFFEGMEEKKQTHERLPDTKKEITKNIMKEITNNLDFVENVDEINHSQIEQLKKLTRKRILEKKTNDRLKQEVTANRVNNTSFNKDNKRTKKFISKII